MPGLNMPRPRFTAEDLDDERQRRKIISWLMQLDEQLRYLLGNLDEENLSSAYEQKLIEAASVTAQVNGKAAQESIDALTGRITRDETFINQNAQAIELKASQDSVNGLESELREAEAKIEPSAIVTTVRTSQGYIDDLGAKANASDLAAKADASALQNYSTRTQTATDIRDAVAAIDEFETASSEIHLTASQAKIATPEFIVSIREAGAEDTALQIDKDGAQMKYLSVSEELNAPNMAEKYKGALALTVGTNGDYPTLQAAFDKLNGRILTGDVEITILSNLTEEAALEGVLGAGRISIQGDNKTLNGKLTVKGCCAPVLIEELTVKAATTDAAVKLIGDRYIEMTLCILEGAGNGQCLKIENGTTANITECELYNATTLIALWYQSDLHAAMLAGGNATYYLQSLASRWTWDGTRPSGTYSEAAKSLHNPADPDNDLTADPGGTAPQPSGQITTTPFTATTGCRGNDWNNSGLWQGAVGDVKYKAVMWFDLSALAGKTVLSASLTLTRRSGAGGSGPVKLHLYNTPVTGTSGDPLDGKTDRGEIGTIANGERTAFIIPAAAVQALFDSSTGDPEGGLMLYMDEATRPIGYSQNYARFGDTGAEKPVLTVTYQ